MFPAAASGQNEGSTSLLFRVPRLATLVIGGDVSTLLTLTADGSGETAYDSGLIESATNATQLTLSTNAAWVLAARLSGTWSSPSGYQKADNDLFLKVTRADGAIQNGADSYVNLSGSDLVIVSGETPVLSGHVNVQTKVLLDWTKDLPGNYAITVAYTLTTQVP